MSNILNRPGWTNKPVNNLILEMARETSFPWVAEVQSLLDKLEEFKFRGSTRETVFSLINKSGFKWLQEPPFKKGIFRIGQFETLSPEIRAKALRDLDKLKDRIKDAKQLKDLLIIKNLNKPEYEEPSNRKDLKKKEDIAAAKVNKINSDAAKVAGEMGGASKDSIPEDILHYIVPVMFARLSYTLEGEDIDIPKIQQVLDSLERYIIQGEEAFAEAVLDIIVNSDDAEESRIAVFIYKAYKNAIKEVTNSAKLGPSFRKGQRASEDTPDKEPNFDIEPKPPENSERLYTTTLGNPENAEMCDYNEAVKISQTKQNQLLTENYRKRRQHQYRINEKYNKQ
tara:strand:+ start:10747 stop:11766 length:1020 start_codon:yes stop_codon:yes gene_type:complete